MSDFPEITIRVHSYCNHPKFVSDCKWCIDGQRVYGDLVRQVEKTLNEPRPSTKLSIIVSNNIK